jgi:AraC-like DNA-binding protein
MNFPAEGNIVVFFQHIVDALQPYAKANHVQIYFNSSEHKMIVRYRPDTILQLLSDFIFQVINQVPFQTTIVIAPILDAGPGILFLKLSIQISGPGLSSIVFKNKSSLDFKHTIDNKHTYELKWQVQPVQSFEDGQLVNVPKPALKVLPDFYAEVRKRLKSHFNKAENLELLLSEQNPKEGAFLKNINKIIIQNLDKDGFNATHLARAINTSRAQLLRRLQSILKQSPASYIKSIRLQKAKEFLETTDLTCGEVAFKTGFQSQSHFTRVFLKQYGLRPSQCRWTEKQHPDKRLQQTG